MEFSVTLERILLWHHEANEFYCAALTQLAVVSSQAISEDGRELLRLCRTGRLYDIDKWIAAGKTLDRPAQRTRP